MSGPDIRTSIVFIVAFFGFIAAAQGTVTLDFDVQYNSVAHQFAWLLSVFPANAKPQLTYAIASPGGHFTTCGTPFPAVVHSDAYSSFPELRANAAGESRFELRASPEGIKGPGR